VGSNPTQGMNVCVRLLSVCTVVCLQVEAWRRPDPRPRSPTDCVKNQGSEKAAKVQQSAVER
jgi:hypothetical protein